MANRLDLQTRFEEILGSRNVYYQPPASVIMQYPAIVYSRRNISTHFAGDTIHIQRPAYDVVLIDKNPDSSYVAKILQIPYSRYDRHYVSDNLHHDSFTIYN